MAPVLKSSDRLSVPAAPLRITLETSSEESESPSQGNEQVSLTLTSMPSSSDPGLSIRGSGAKLSVISTICTRSSTPGAWRMTLQSSPS